MSWMKLGTAALVAAALAPSGPARAQAQNHPDSLGVTVWEQTLHSHPDVAHRGQPFEVLIHLVWGSRTGDETVLPIWHPQPDIRLLRSGYLARSSRDQPGGGYAMHAQIRYELVPGKEGTLPIDSLSVVRGKHKVTIENEEMRKEAWKTYFGIVMA